MNIIFSSHTKLLRYSSFFARKKNPKSKWNFWNENFCLTFFLFVYVKRGYSNKNNFLKCDISFCLCHIISLFLFIYFFLFSLDVHTIFDWWSLMIVSLNDWLLRITWFRSVEWFFFLSIVCYNNNNRFKLYNCRRLVRTTVRVYFSEAASSPGMESLGIGFGPRKTSWKVEKFDKRKNPAKVLEFYHIFKAVTL